MAAIVSSFFRLSLQLYKPITPTMSLVTAKKAKVETCFHSGEARLMVKKLSEHATIPSRGSSHAAGYDLYR